MRRRKTLCAIDLLAISFVLCSMGKWQVGGFRRLCVPLRICCGCRQFHASTPAIRSVPCRLVATLPAAIPAIWYDSCNHHRGAAHHCRVHFSALVPLVPVLLGDHILVGVHAMNSGNPSRTATIQNVAGRVCISVYYSTSQAADLIVAGRTPPGLNRPLLRSIPAGAPIRLDCAPAQSRTRGTCVPVPLITTADATGNPASEICDSACSGSTPSKSAKYITA